MNTYVTWSIGLVVAALIVVFIIKPWWKQRKAARKTISSEGTSGRNTRLR